MEMEKSAFWNYFHVCVTSKFLILTKETEQRIV